MAWPTKVPMAPGNTAPATYAVSPPANRNPIMPPVAPGISPGSPIAPTPNMTVPPVQPLPTTIAPPPVIPKVALVGTKTGKSGKGANLGKYLHPAKGVK